MARQYTQGLDTFLGQQGVSASRAGKGAMYTDPSILKNPLAYYGQGATQTLGNEAFGTNDLQSINISREVGEKLARKLTGAQYASPLSVADGIYDLADPSKVSARFSYSDAAGLRLPFSTQEGDVGVASYRGEVVSKGELTGKKAWMPIGGPAWQQTLHKLVSLATSGVQAQRSVPFAVEAMRMIDVAAALGMSQALAADKAGQSSTLGYLKATTELYNRFASSNAAASNKGRLGFARLVGTHAGEGMFRPEDLGRMQQSLANGQKFTGFQLGPGGLARLKGRVSPTKQPLANGQCSPTRSGPGVSAQWNLTKKKNKSGTVSCSPTSRIALGSHRKNTDMGAFANLKEFAAQLDGVTDQYTSAAAKAQYLRPGRDDPELQWFNPQNPNETHRERNTRVAQAQARAHSGSNVRFD